LDEYRWEVIDQNEQRSSEDPEKWIKLNTLLAMKPVCSKDWEGNYWLEKKIATQLLDISFEFREGVKWDLGAEAQVLETFFCS
jgi:hypothetical protein